MIAVEKGQRHYTLPLEPTVEDRILDAACRLMDAADERDEHPILWESAVEKLRRALT